MKNCIRYIVWAILVFFAFILILDAFADDDQYRKKHRYRWGSHDDDDHDRGEYLKPVINQAYEALNQFNWTEQELIAYEQELKRIRDNRAAEDYLIEKGKAEGETNKAIEIAKNLLRQNVDLSIISASTGLSPEELTALKDEL